jgi:LysR family transcriptional regulator, hydrogen peroxide-inducible genes activator
MTLIQLEYIVAVDAYRHFGKAAESCHVTQPTLSMQIHKLEEQLGVLIFDRNKQPIAPTEAGARIISQAQRTLLESRKIEEMIRIEKGEMIGELTIGIIPTLSPYLLPLFVNSFLEKYPEINLNIEELITADIVNRLQEERLDIGLLVSPLHVNGLVVRDIFNEEFIAYVSNRSPLFHKELLTYEDLQTSELLLLNEGHCFREQVLNICQHYHQRDSRLRYESGSLEALKRLVDKHGGVTLMPALATLEMDGNSRQRLRHFADPVPTREVSLVTHSNYLKLRIAEALYKEIHNAVPEYLNITKNNEIIRWK